MNEIFMFWIYNFFPLNETNEIFMFWIYNFFPMNEINFILFFASHLNFKLQLPLSTSHLLDRKTDELFEK